MMAEHPIETARRALREAAAAENEDWWAILRQIARSLPDRSRTPWPPPEAAVLTLHREDT